MNTNQWARRLPWSTIDDVADTENVPKNLIGAIIQTESSGNKFACRFEPGYKYLYKPKEFAKDIGITEATETIFQMTSWGLCQIMGAVARETGLKGHIFQLLDEQINIQYCCKIIKKLAQRYTERDDIIAAYNAGIPTKQLNGLYKNQVYVDKVKLYLSAIDLIMGEDKHGQFN